MLVVGDDDDVQAIPLFGLVTCENKNPRVRGGVRCIVLSLASEMLWWARPMVV